MLKAFYAPSPEKGTRGWSKQHSYTEQRLPETHLTPPASKCAITFAVKLLNHVKDLTKAR